ncbi:hypothetical protein [Nocardioides endophyticus]|uniref:hypothetical protein n=1 Tax=Nocardioides endophyticus TaxID=1353775 RepID=UPI0031E7556E
MVAYVEGLTIRELWNGAAAGGADTLSLRLMPNAESGSAPLALAQESLTAMRRLLVGSTTALSNDALVLPSRRPAVAETYAAEARVSTRPGSFILDVELPLTVKVEQANIPAWQQSLMAAPALPIGRRVSERLSLVASNALTMAQLVEDGEADISEFSDPTLRLGNNLELEGLARLGGDESTDYQLRIAQSALAPRSTPSTRLRATPAQRDRLSEAAEYLRSSQDQRGVTIQGTVVRLFREGGLGPGDVTLQTVLDDSGKAKTCIMHLAEDDYAEALRAHREGLPVVATGDLVTAGNNRKRLRDVSEFRVARPAT